MLSNMYLKLALSFCLLPQCGIAMAEQLQLPINEGLNTEFAWLLGAVVSAFSVISRRSQSYAQEHG